MLRPVIHETVLFYPNDENPVYIDRHKEEIRYGSSRYFRSIKYI